MPPRLLIFTTDLEIGGTPTVVRELAVRLAGRGHAVEVGCLAATGPTGEAIAAAGIAVHALGARSARDVAAVWRLRRLIRTGGYTRVLSLLVHANAAAAVACAGRRQVRLFQSVQTTQPEPRWHWRVQGWAARSAERIIVPSEAAAAVTRERSGVPAEKIVVIPNAVDADAFAPTRDPTPGDDGRVSLIFLGRLDPVKRVVDLIAAMRSLPPAYALHVFGQGEDEPRLRNAARDLVGRVTFHGPAASPAAAFAAVPGTRILVLPSQAEGFGLVLIEAMAAGIPVVASRAPGITEVVEDEVSGLLFPIGDTAALAAAVRQVAEQPAVRDRLITASRGRVRSQYAWPPVLAAYERLLGL